MIEVKQQINDVQREVGTRTVPAGEAQTVTISQTYQAAIDDVWDACTNPERIPRWFLPVSGDLRPGGHYALTGNASGTIERCDPPTSFFATWEFGGQVTWIEVRLSAVTQDRTRLEIEHITLVGDDRWQQFGPGAVGVGWDLAVMGLANHLGTGEGVSPGDGPAWLGSPDGRAFMTLSSEGWRDAHIAAGADAAQARSAAERTITAYTGG
jgi:uncharacterized protein YndB with AHSA1/START domain